MRVILLVALALTSSSAYYLNDWNQFCAIDTNGTNCYDIFEDTSFPHVFYFYNSIIKWEYAIAAWPYASWATSLAMVLTYSLKLWQIDMGWPVHNWERISAAYIMLKGYEWGLEPGYFNCSSGNIDGQWAGYTFMDGRIYNDWNFYTDLYYNQWCNWNLYTTYLANEPSTAEQYDFGLNDIDLTGMTYLQIKAQMKLYGMLMTTIAISNGLALSPEVIPNNKYVYTYAPSTFWSYETVAIFGVWQDTDGIWLMANIIQTDATYNKMIWIRPEQSATGWYTYAQATVNARTMVGSLYYQFAPWSPWNYYSVPPSNWIGN